MRHCNLLI